MPFLFVFDLFFLQCQRFTIESEGHLVAVDSEFGFAHGLVVVLVFQIGRAFACGLVESVGAVCAGVFGGLASVVGHLVEAVGLLEIEAISGVLARCLAIGEFPIGSVKDILLFLGRNIGSVCHKTRDRCRFCHPS